MPGPETEAMELLDPVLAVFRGRLQATLAGHAVTGYLKGAAVMTSWGRTKLRGLPILFEGPPLQQAINYATKHAAQLVTAMDDETKSRLAKVIADGIENKRGIDGLARDIRTEIGDMTTKRSKLIAQTETSDSLEQAFLDRSGAMGVTGKEWVTAADERLCDFCAGNEDEGPIAIGQEFSGGVMRPPQHPGCRCALAPVMLEKS